MCPRPRTALKRMKQAPAVNQRHFGTRPKGRLSTVNDRNSAAALLARRFLRRNSIPRSPELSSRRDAGCLLPSDCRGHLITNSYRTHARGRSAHTQGNRGFPHWLSNLQSNSSPHRFTANHQFTTAYLCVPNRLDHGAKTRFVVVGKACLRLGPDPAAWTCSL